MIKKPLLFFGVVVATSFFSLRAQQVERPAVTIKAIENLPEIDGNVINDPVWQRIEPLTRMIQIKPNFGMPASEDTQIRLAYTDKALLVSVVCFDKNPSKIVVSDSRRDASLDDDDSFLFIIDTYHDQQNGFLFGTNADGMEYDAQINNEGSGNFSANRQQGGVIGGTNLNWDTAWEVKSIKGDFGWSAEFAIPLRSIRFSPGEHKSWGINFQRNISKTSEVAYWASLPIGFDIKRVSMAGALEGLSLKTPKNLKVMPYGLSQTNFDKIQNASDTNLQAGMDVKYSLTPALTLDLSYNTDFAQVEVDEEQVNLDRFNLFFPEKRPFFLENAGQFSVGSPGEVDLFFSRRIGIGSEGDLVPIIGGSRISGKLGQTNVGFLSMFTDEVLDAGIDKNNFTVARVNHDFGGSRSSLGALYVGRDGLGDTSGDFNRVMAVDGKLGFGKKAQLSGFLAKSTTPGITQNDHSFKFMYNYTWNQWIINLGYTEVGEGFNPEVGFLMRSSFKKPEFLVLKSIRPNNMGNILELRPHISYRTYRNFDHQMESSFLHIDNHWVFKSGFEIHSGINFTGEGVYDSFAISEVSIDPGVYKQSELMFVLLTNANNPVTYSTRTTIGGYFGGNRISSANTLTMRLGDKFNSSLNFNYNELHLPNGDLNVIVSGAKLAYSFTPRMFLQSLIQYNSISKITSVNTRFGWLRDANTGLFVVFNIIKDQDVFNPINNQIFTVKYTHNFDVFGK